MATKNKKNAEESNKSTNETWRKPLQVPPRANAMRSFYQGGEDIPNQPPTQEGSPPLTPEKTVHPAKFKESNKVLALPAIQSRKAVGKAELAPTADAAPPPVPQNGDTASESIAGQPNKLTEEELSRHLGFEIDDLFDIDELLRGKSFNIYQALMLFCDENGRCKITQPELMKRTGIKNRRTFYKHEEWLIKLNLLEKRHFPGDHKGIVYRVFAMSAVLPVSPLMLEQLAIRLNNPE